MERRLDDEIRFHIEMQVERNVRLGMPDDEARRAARVAFGGSERFKEDARDEYRSRLLDELGQDLRFALRVLRRNRGYTAAVVLTLAVGLGALSAGFTVFSAVLLEPLPLRAPDRVVQIWSGTGPNVHGPTSAANFLDLRDAARSFDTMAAEDFAWFNLGGDAAAPPERLMGNLVTSGFFSAVGAQPALGRAFSTDDVGARVVVLSDRIWRQRFDGDVTIVGRAVQLNGEPYTVAGIMPAGFDFPGPLVRQRIDLWTPLTWGPGQAERGMRELGITARIKDDVAFEQAQRDLDAVAHRLASDHPRENTDLAIRAVPLLEEMVGPSRRMLRVLLGAVAMVLLIACSNVANLTLARGSARGQELQLRTALGAGRSRVARQLLTESVLLAAAGGVLGLLGAVWLTRALVALEPEGLPRLQEIGVDGRVLVFSLVMSVFAGLCFGALPAVSASGGRLSAALGGAGRSVTEGHERRRLRSAIVVAQVALALVLLVGAGLLLRSLDRLTSESPGFDPAGVLVARVSLDRTRYGNPERQMRYVSSAVERLAALPGVERAGAVNYLPFGIGDAFLDISIDGRPRTRPDEEVAAHLRSVTSGYFAAMRIGLLAGRDFGDGDGAASLPVAIVNRAMVRRYWPDLTLPSILGRRVRVGTDESAGPWLTIVGIAGDVKHWSLGEEYGAELYMPLAQSSAAALHFVARGGGGGTPLSGDLVRSTLLAIDASQPVSIEPLEGLVSASVAQPRFRALLFGFFAALALLLAVIGIYGVIAYRVSQRTREIGVRLALGARRVDIVALVVRQGLVLTGAGVGIGLVASFWLTRFLQGMLYRVTPTDAMTFVGVSALLAVTALLANLLPARRAARVDPVSALRGE